MGLDQRFLNKKDSFDFAENADYTQWGQLLMTGKLALRLFMTPPNFGIPRRETK